jgi:hypothetical protein
VFPLPASAFVPLAKSIHQELIVKKILAIAITSILASAMAFAQDTSSTTSTGSADNQAASANTKKAKKHSKKHAKKAKSSKAAPASTETAPK